MINITLIFFETPPFIVAIVETFHSLVSLLDKNVKFYLLCKALYNYTLHLLLLISHYNLQIHAKHPPLVLLVFCISSTSTFSPQFTQAPSSL